MYCHLCRKKIGVVRRLFDPQYCSGDHRKKARKASARLAREYDPGFYYEDPWPIFNPNAEEKKPKPKLSMGAVMFTCTLALSLGVAIALNPGGGGAPSGVESAGGTLPASGTATTAPRGDGFFTGLKNMLPQRESVSVRENFQKGLGNWAGAGDWATGTGFVRPAGLRLLKPTMSLQDYQFEFEGQIEKKGLNWAFRAPNLQNYYATKIVISRPGPLPTADLVRMIVVDGKELMRTRYPLPLTIQKETLYHVAVNIKGADFVTTVNGQIVDTWSDNRLHAGGVGFFSEKGESAAIRWMSISQKKSILDSVFAAAVPMAAFADLSY